ncbi:DUF4230 domain-containing protein [Spongiivirga citrea]|uniref:DUF4230 domain-containing protein n=1 Tax=Spongiivirga citrea TaxID=1481457 RepID=A0A6M0CJX0_9FLAO|nr:DUF4230 domain-containing protein [Spongiivirga citrea]NER18151.1 DUF4230 domain-containing protein [Spongiivirga citrea]
MESILIAILSLILGGVLVYAGSVYIQKQRKNSITHQQSAILLEKIKRVCKLITVEGDFAEIYHYENTKEKLLKLISSKKKALVIINAKAYVGFDLTKIKMTAKDKSKLIVLESFPQPEVLSIDTNVQYYDKKDGYFNKFEAADLTELNTEAKEHIRAKVPQSGLYGSAAKEALDTILLIEQIVETIGWKLDYKALELPDAQIKKIE